MKWATLMMAAVMAVGCGDKDCTDSDYECDGDVLMECVDGELVESQDCAASEMICHNMGDGTDHCMEDGAMDSGE